MMADTGADVPTEFVVTVTKAMSALLPVMVNGTVLIYCDPVASEAAFWNPCVRLSADRAGRQRQMASLPLGRPDRAAFAYAGRQFATVEAEMPLVFGGKRAYNF